MRYLCSFVVFAVLSVSSGTAPLIAQEQPPPRQAPADEYVPLDQLPPQEELPAAPMVVAAYTFVWAAFLFYAFTIVRRITRLEGELRGLEARTPDGTVPRAR